MLTVGLLIKEPSMLNPYSDLPFSYQELATDIMRLNRIFGGIVILSNDITEIRNATIY